MAEVKVDERIKFLDEASTVQEKDGTKERTITEENYRRYMKKFFEFDPKLLAELKKAKEEFHTDLIRLTGNDLVENKNIDQSVVKVRTESGRIVTKFRREKEFTNPQTGEKFTKPSITMDVKIKSYINKSILEELEQKIKGKL